MPALGSLNYQLLTGEPALTFDGNPGPVHPLNRRRRLETIERFETPRLRRGDEIDCVGFAGRLASHGRVEVAPQAALADAASDHVLVVRVVLDAPIGQGSDAAGPGTLRLAEIVREFVKTECQRLDH